MNSKQYILSINKKLTNKLAGSALGYLCTGLKLFHEARKDRYIPMQPTIGNLAISIELMIKAYIMKNNSSLLFVDLPLELQICFANPTKIPKSFNWRYFDVDLRSFNYKMIDLAKCIEMFYIFFQDNKQELKIFLDFLSKCRNSCVHASLPSFQRYDLEKIAYLSIRIYEVLDKEKTFLYASRVLTDKDKEFINLFKKEKIEIVKKKIEDAKKKAKTIPENFEASSGASGWEEYEKECPVCESMGLLLGYTELEADDHYEESYNLTFFAETFECNCCGLKLNDMAELELANVDVWYDRTDELDQWFLDHAEEPDFDDIGD